MPAAVVEACRHFPARARRLRSLKALPVSGRLSGVVRQVENETTRAQRLLAGHGITANATPDYWALGERLERVIVDLQEAVVDHVLVSRPVSPVTTEAYRDHYRVAATRSGRGACACGARTVDKILDAPLDADARRIITVCRACGIIVDVPDPPPLAVTYDVRIAPDGGRIEVRAACARAGRDPALVTAAACLVSPVHPRSVLQAAVSDPATIRVADGAPAAASVALPYPPAARGGRCVLRVVLLANMELMLLQRPLFVVERRAGART